MRRHGPFKPTDPNICVWDGVPDVINPANFFENRPKGFGAGRRRNLAFPVDFVGRPYKLQHSHTTVRACDNVLSADCIYSICYVRVRQMIPILQTFCKDARCDVHQCLLAVRETKLGWFNLFCPGAIACVDNGQLYSTMVHTCHCQQKLNYFRYFFLDLSGVVLVAALLFTFIFRFLCFFRDHFPLI